MSDFGFADAERKANTRLKAEIERLTSELAIAEESIKIDASESVLREKEIERLTTLVQLRSATADARYIKVHQLHERIKVLEGVYRAAQWFSIHMPENHVYGLIEKGNYCLLRDAIAAADKGSK